MRGVSFDELLDYSSEETHRWRDWFIKNPAALDLATDIAGTRNVRELVLHIVIVQQRYSERLLSLAITEYEAMSSKTAGELFSLADNSVDNLRQFAHNANDNDWDGMMSFPTRSAGTLTASRRKIFVHALMHGIRHWAQLATYLRQQGFKQDWQHDILMSSAMQ